MKAQRLHRLLVQTRHGSRFVAHAQINQCNLGRLFIVAEQLQIDIGQAGCRPVPDGAAQMRPESLEPLHPVKGQAAKGTQLTRLGVGTEQCDVLTHRILDGQVIGQGRALRQAQLTDSPSLGRAVLQPFLDYQPRRGGGNFLGGAHNVDCARKRKATPACP